MSTLIIIGAVITNTGVTLYTEDGMSKTLASTDYRTADILDRVLPELYKHGRSELNLGEFSIAKIIEEKTGGAVKVTTNSYGEVTSISSNNKMIEAALTGDLGAALTGVLEDAVSGDSVKGLPAFIENFSSIQREHSQKELLDFMKRCDLPIADDGSIIVYKVLRRDPNREAYYVDCHTRTVPQRVGSVVRMPESRVDPNRRNLCSSGYHVCSRTYIGNFSGDVVVLCKVKPQDVIAVPLDYNGSKMRVKEYSIVAEIPTHLYNRLKRNAAMNSEEEGAKLIGRVVAGQHAQPIEIVEELEPGKVTVTPIVREERVKTEKKVKTKAKPIFERKQEKEKKVEAITPKAVQSKLKEIKLESSKLTEAQKAYNKKLEKAKKLWMKGDMSIRAIAEKLGMDRNSLAKNLKNAA
jgi:hypothetical protein